MGDVTEREVSTEALRDVLGTDLKQHYPSWSIRKIANTRGTPMLRLEHPDMAEAFHITIAKSRR